MISEYTASFISIRVAPNPFGFRANGNPACSEPSVLKCLGTNSAAVVPAQAGPITTSFQIIAGPATSLCCGVWVPACAGTTMESLLYISECGPPAKPSARSHASIPHDGAHAPGCA